MTIFYAAFACCILSLVYAAPKAPNSSLTVRGQDIELAGRGVLDLKDTGDIEALFSVLYELCDYFNTCNKSLHVPNDVQAFLGCCVPCDCSDDCFLVGNCCRDKVGEPRRTNSGQIVGENGEVCTLTKPIDDLDETMSFLLVTQCHPDYQGEARDICYEPSGGKIDELIPVYSEQTGLSYFNIHCARCNYQTNSLTPWEFSVLCDSYTPVRSFAKMDTMIQDGCRFVSLPKNQNKKCYTATESDECKRARYQTLCGTLPESYGFVKLLEKYACHCVLPLSNFATCFAISSPDYYSYQTLLNLNTVAEYLVSEPPSDLTDTEAICPEGERFNPIEQKCLRLTCSPSQISVNADDNICIDLYGVVVGLCLDYRLSVTVTAGDTPSSYIEDLAMKEVRNTLLPIVSPLQTEVVDYSSANNSVTYNIRAVYVFDNFGSVRSQFKRFEDEFQNDVVVFSVRIKPDTTGLAFMPQPLEEISYLSYADNLAAKGCQKTIAMSGIQFCEMVMFSPKEYRIRDGVVVERGGREFHPHEYVFRESRDGIRHVQVCLETYRVRKSRPTVNSGIAVEANEIQKLVSLVLAQLLLYSILH